MKLKPSYDIAIIGAGPGGYVAAIRAAQLGLSAVLVEQNEPGGVCLNWGCIPSKSLIHSAQQYASLRQLESWGVGVDRSGFRYGLVYEQSRQAAHTLSQGVRGLLRKNKVELLKARARIAGAGKIHLTGGDFNNQSLRSDNIIVATGSSPLTPPGFEVDEQRVLSSTGILNLTVLPQSLVILGAGAIGCEFAYIMNAFGVKVTLVEMADRILPGFDRDAAACLQQSLQAAGVVVHTGSRAESLDLRQEDIGVRISSQDSGRELTADKVLVAFGRVPNTGDIGLDSIDLACDERGYIPVDGLGRTAVGGVFAIGDVTASPALAHVASAEAERVVEWIAGKCSDGAEEDSRPIPSVVYTEPQVAGFGATAEQFKQSGSEPAVFSFPLRASGLAVATGETEGFVKILSDPESGEILGGCVVGHKASELIHELLLARQGELLVDDVASMIHAHPSLAEAIGEAAKGILHAPIHL